MASAAAEEKTAEELRKEIVELHRQQREITERLRDPRGLRRAGVTPVGPGHDGGARFRGFVRPAAESEHQPAPKKRLLSAVIKLEDGEIKPEVDGADPAKEQVSAAETRPNLVGEINNTRSVNPMNNGGLRRDITPRMRKMDFDFPPAEPVPRVLPKNEDPSLIKRNRRMLGQLLGTLEKFQEEDQKLSTSEAYMKRTDSLRRAEQKARDESERLRQQEREQIAEKRRRDLTLRARVAAKAEEKKLELLFITWSEHHKKLSNFLRTKAEPAIYYMPTRPLSGDASVIEQRKEQTFVEWKSTRRAELSEYQRQIGEQYVANAEAELLRWQNTRNARRANLVNNATTNLQETMDKELETHKLEHGPKTRRIQGSNDEDDDVEDIVIEDELLDEVLDAQDKIDGHDATKPMEAGNVSPEP